MKTIDPKLIKCDPAFHSRAELNEDIVADYVEDMKRGDEFPPVLVYWDGTHEEYILADGFHRVTAWRQINPTGYIPVQLKLGTEEDARWGAICANQDHGLRRSNTDKRRAVELALLHPRGAKLSNRLIARFTGVDHVTVMNIRKKMETGGEIHHLTYREGADGKVYDTTNIGETQMETSDKTCLECRLFRDGRCRFSADYKEPEDQACEEFRPIEIKRVEPIPDRSNVKILENWGDNSPKKTNEHHCRKAGSVNVHIYEDNPTLSAVELRHMLGNDWLAELYAAIHLMLIGDKEDTNNR